MTFARLRHDGWETRIFPLDEPASALLVGCGRLDQLQGPADDVTGGIPHGVDVAFTADAVFSAATVAALRAEATRRSKVVQAAIKHGTPLWRSATRMRPSEGDLRIPLWAGPLGRLEPRRDGPAVDALGAVDVVAVCDESTCETVRVPPYGVAPHTIDIPKVARLGGQILHWLDLLELSLAALGTARTGRNRLGKVDIHPTATVIDSIIEDGVKVEPHASVINSYLGKNVLVADHSVVHSSVIGHDCRSLVDTSLRRIVAMPASTLSNLGFSDSVIGANVFLTTSVATFARPGVGVVVEGHDTKRPLIGAAIGARCVLGSRALLAAGTALPPGLLVVARPGEAAIKLDDEGLARATMLRGDPSRNF